MRIRLNSYGRLAFAACWLCLPGMTPCLAANGTAGSPLAVHISETRQEAAEHERAGRWEDAMHAYMRLAAHNRSDAEVSDRLAHCLRRVLQGKRQRDPETTKPFLKLDYATALKTYQEALEKIHTHFVHREKADYARLFGLGVTELENALNDSEFRKRHFPEATDKDLKAFRKYLGDVRSVIRPQSAAEATRFAEELANRARRDFACRKSPAILLELLCGACNGLDAHSQFIPAKKWLEEAQEATEASVANAAMPRPGVGYVRIRRFQDSTAQDLDDALSQLRMQDGGLKSLVIDLRGNPGGLLESAVAIAQRFLQTGSIVSLRGQLPEANRTYTALGGMNVLDIPLVLLVDQETASAAEVLAAALAGNHRATLVGAQTYGKGTLQGLLPLQTSPVGEDATARKTSSAGAVRITLARLSDPHGAPLQSIVPQILERDPLRQMDAALDYAGRQMN
jgi:tetratricopeptide (TPR) repeat protein